MNKVKICFFGEHISNNSLEWPVRHFLTSVAVRDRAKILACLKCLEELGFQCPRVQLKQIVGKVWEIKINCYKSAYRLFYTTLTGPTIVLLHGFKKKSQKIPGKEIEIACKRIREVLQYEQEYLR